MRSMALGTAVLAVVSISVPAYSDEGIFPGGRWWGEPLIESFCNGSVVLGPLIEIDASPTGVCGSSGPGGSESGVGHQLGRNAGGKVFAWGANYPYGQTSVPGDLPPCLAVAAGHNHSVALTQTGVVRCWGDNTYGQLGDGTTVTRSNPKWKFPVDFTGIIPAGNEPLAVRAGSTPTTNGRPD